MKIRGSVQLQTVLAMYNKEIDRNLTLPSCQRLTTMVRRHIDQTIRTVLSVLRERTVGECYQWKAKEVIVDKKSTIVFSCSNGAGTD